MPKFSLTGRLAELHTLNLISPKAAYDNWLSRMKTCNLFSLGFKEQIRCSGRFFFSKCTTCFKPHRIWFCDVLRNLPPVTRATSLFSSFEYRQKKKEKKDQSQPSEWSVCPISPPQGFVPCFWLKDRPVNHLVCSLLEMTSVPSRCLMSLSGAQWEPGFVRKRKTNWLSSCCTRAGSASSFYISSKTSKYINIFVIFHNSCSLLWDQDTTLQSCETFLLSCQPVQLLNKHNMIILSVQYYKLCVLHLVLSPQSSEQPEDHAPLTDCLQLRGKGRAKVVKPRPRYHSHPVDITAALCNHRAHKNNNLEKRKKNLSLNWIRINALKAS